MDFSDNTTKNRFELNSHGFISYADYRRSGNDLYIDYVYAPPELRGSGAAGELMQNIVSKASKENLTIVPICGYAVSWIKRHP